MIDQGVVIKVVYSLLFLQYIGYLFVDCCIGRLSSGILAAGDGETKLIVDDLIVLHEFMVLFVDIVVTDLSFIDEA